MGCWNYLRSPTSKIGEMPRFKPGGRWFESISDDDSFPCQIACVVPISSMPPSTLLKDNRGENRSAQQIGRIGLVARPRFDHTHLRSDILLQGLEIFDYLHAFFFRKFAADHALAEWTVVEFMPGVRVAGLVGAELLGSL